MSIVIDDPQIEARLSAFATARGIDLIHAVQALLDQSERPDNPRMRSAQESGEDDPLEKALSRLHQRTPAQIEQAQEEARSLLLAPARSLPVGQSLAEALAGSWPGQESEEEIAAALQKLS